MTRTPPRIAPRGDGEPAPPDSSRGRGLSSWSPPCSLPPCGRLAPRRLVRPRVAWFADAPTAPGAETRPACAERETLSSRPTPGWRAVISSPQAPAACGMDPRGDRHLGRRESLSRSVARLGISLPGGIDPIGLSLAEEAEGPPDGSRSTSPRLRRLPAIPALILFTLGGRRSPPARAQPPSPLVRSQPRAPSPTSPPPGTAPAPFGRGSTARASPEGRCSSLHRRRAGHRPAARASQASSPRVTGRSAGPSHRTPRTPRPSPSPHPRRPHGSREKKDRFSSPPPTGGRRPGSRVESPPQPGVVLRPPLRPHCPRGHPPPPDHDGSSQDALRAPFIDRRRLQARDRELPASDELADATAASPAWRSPRSTSPTVSGSTACSRRGTTAPTSRASPCPSGRISDE